MRDDFPEPVKLLLAKRVGYRCSNPDCQRSTSGPTMTTSEAVNMGVAAHITAASPRGPRYDPSLTAEQRRSYENGIWLCNYHGDLVDKDEAGYPVEVLREWKRLAEERARIELHGVSPARAEWASSEPQENSLTNWMNDSRKRWTELVGKDLSHEKPSRFEHGIWMVAYSLNGNFPPTQPHQLKSLLKEVQDDRLGVNGYAVWAVTTYYGTIELETHAYNNLTESWMGKEQCNSAFSHFWRASPDRLMFLLRGYTEDCWPEKVDPGVALWLRTPTYDVTECLLHAKRLAKILGDEEASAIISFTWEGLTGRTLRPWHVEKGRPTWFDHTAKTCQQGSVITPPEIISVKDIPTKLAEIVHEITKPLFYAFNFYEPSPGDIREDIAKLLNR